MAWLCLSVGGSTIFVQTEICQQLFDEWDGWHPNTGFHSGLLVKVRLTEINWSKKNYSATDQSSHQNSIPGNGGLYCCVEWNHRPLNALNNTGDLRACCAVFKPAQISSACPMNFFHSWCNQKYPSWVKNHPIWQHWSLDRCHKVTLRIWT